jgi:hypothetical protein
MAYIVYKINYEKIENISSDLCEFLIKYGKTVEDNGVILPIDLCVIDCINENLEDRPVLKKEFKKWIEKFDRACLEKGLDLFID